MKMVYFICIFLSWLMLSTSAVAQSNDPVEVPTKTDDLEEIQLKSRMEESLARDIQSYLGHNRFIINVNVKLERIRQVIKKQNSRTQEKNNKGYQPTFLPKLTFPTSQDDAEGDGVESLPGLPFVDIPADKEKDAELQFMREQIQRLQQEQRQPRWQNGSNSENDGESEETIGVFNRIAKLTVTLAVEDTIKAEQEAFLRNLVYQKSALNDLRGDELKIIKTEFSSVPLLEDESIPESLKDDYLGDKAPAETWLEENFDMLQLGLLSLLALLLLSLIILSLRKKPAEKQDSVPPPMPANNEPIQTNTSVPEDKGQDQKQVMQKTRQDIISLGLGQPQHVQGSMDQLLGQEDKIPMAASIYKVLGRSLFRSIFPNVEQQQLQSIMAQLADQPPEEDQQFQDVQDFYQLLQKAVHDSVEVKTHPFEFLGNLNDSQVLYLIQHEDARIQALVISQLDAQQGARVLNRISEKRQAQVIAELGQFETFPLDTFKDVADRLAKAALTVPSFENVNADGLHMLMNMLDNMNSIEESKVLKRLKQDKPDTFYKLRQQYFTFADVLKTPKQILSNALREVERSYIGRAICGTPDEFKIYVLSVLTPKLKALVKEDLKRYEGRIGAKDIEPARKAIVHKLREYIHTGKFSMDQLQVKKQAES